MYNRYSSSVFHYHCQNAPCLNIKIEKSENCIMAGVSESLAVISFSLWPGQNTGVGSLSLLQGIFPTQGSNSGLPHCRQILYQLSYKGSPGILESVAYPFSSGSSDPGIELASPAMQVFSLPPELSGKGFTLLVWSGSNTSIQRTVVLAFFFLLEY